jgi:hypothetical protein
MLCRCELRWLDRRRPADLIEALIGVVLPAAPPSVHFDAAERRRLQQALGHLRRASLPRGLFPQTFSGICSKALGTYGSAAESIVPTIACEHPSTL